MAGTSSSADRPLDAPPQVSHTPLHCSSVPLLLEVSVPLGGRHPAASLPQHPACTLIQAFSHWTYAYTRGALMVVDIQGVGDTYTDPQIHTWNSKAFTKGNLGASGQERFFATHQCNAVCAYLSLPPYANGRYGQEGHPCTPVRAPGPVRLPAFPAARFIAHLRPEAQDTLSLTILCLTTAAYEAARIQWQTVAESKASVGPAECRALVQQTLGLVAGASEDAAEDVVGPVVEALLVGGELSFANYICWRAGLHRAAQKSRSS